MADELRSDEVRRSSHSDDQHPDTVEKPAEHIEASSKPSPEKGVASIEELAKPFERHDSPKTPSGPVWVIVVLSILSSTFLFALDNTVVADIQPRIIESFNEIQKLPWISVAFALGGVSVNLVW